MKKGDPFDRDQGPTAAERARIDLRDRFAVAALTGILGREGPWADDDRLANLCYNIADAMLEARGGT